MIKSVFCLRQPWNYKHYVTVRFVCLAAPHSLWDLNSPHQGLNSGPPRWKGGSLTIGPPGKERKKVKSAQSCPTLCSPMDCSPPGSSVHGIFQARILQRVAISYSRGSSRLRNQNCVSCASYSGRQILYHCATWEPSNKPQHSHKPKPNGARLYLFSSLWKLKEMRKLQKKNLKLVEVGSEF